MKRRTFRKTGISTSVPLWRRQNGRVIIPSVIKVGPSAHAAATIVQRSRAAVAMTRGVELEEVAHHPRREALGWHIVEWCQSKRPEGLDRAIDVLERSPTTAAVDHEEWMSFGLAGPALWSLTIAESIHESRVRLLGGDTSLRAAGKAA